MKYSIDKDHELNKKDLELYNKNDHELSNGQGSWLIQ